MPFRFGAFTFDEHARQLLREGESVHLSPKAFHLFEVLIERRPHPVSRETLVQQIWPDVVVEPGNLHGLIAEIRVALRDSEHEIIRTVHRFGYAFTATGASESGPRFSIILDGRQIPLKIGENVIGRDPHDEISIHSPDVSRHHARLVVIGPTVTLEDLGSKNGTYLGTARVISPTAIGHGDEILVGTVRLQLIRADALASTATAG